MPTTALLAPSRPAPAPPRDLPVDVVRAAAAPVTAYLAVVAASLSGARLAADLEQPALLLGITAAAWATYTLGESDALSGLTIVAGTFWSLVSSVLGAWGPPREP